MKRWINNLAQWIWRRTSGPRQRALRQFHAHLVFALADDFRGLVSQTDELTKQLAAAEARREAQAAAAAHETSLMMECLVRELARLHARVDALAAAQSDAPADESDAAARVIRLAPLPPPSVHYRNTA